MSKARPHLAKYIELRNKLPGGQWVTNRQCRTQGDEAKGAMFGVGSIMAWGAVELVRVSDDICWQDKKSVEEAIAALPDILDLVIEQATKIAHLYDKEERNIRRSLK